MKNKNKTICNRPECNFSPKPQKKKEKKKKVIPFGTGSLYKGVPPPHTQA